MQREEAAARDDQLETDEAVHLFHVAKQLDLSFGSGSEIGVAAFTRSDDVAVAVPGENCLSQASAGGDERAGAVRGGRTFIQSTEVFGGQAWQGVAGGFQIIQEDDMAGGSVGVDRGGVNAPGVNGGWDFLDGHGAG